MLRTVQFACSLPTADADAENAENAENAESGRVYTHMLVWNYRLYRKHGIWLAPKSGERLEDALGGPTTLHAHSRDAASVRHRFSGGRGDRQQRHVSVRPADAERKQDG